MLATLRDSREWMRSLNTRRTRNAVRVWNGFRQAKRGGDALMPGMPIAISMEPTTACNLRCPECPSGLRAFTRPTGNLKPQFFHNVLDELADDLVALTFYFQGEPYINPHFLDMVTDASDRGVYTITSTNAHFLDEEQAERTVRSGLKRLIISIDGADQETYQQYRKEGELSKVIAGAERVVKWKRLLKSRTPHIVFQFLVVKPNEHQIPQVRAIAKQVGVDDLWLKTAQVYDPREDHPLIPTQDKYARYKRSPDGTWQVKNALSDHCWRMWRGSVITWDGRVVPCCFDKDAHHVLGDLRSSSFKEVWHGNAYRDFRTTLFRSRSSIEMCKNCSEGSPVWA